jgi:hypothetical protein
MVDGIIQHLGEGVADDSPCAIIRIYGQILGDPAPHLVLSQAQQSQFALPRRVLRVGYGGQALGECAPVQSCTDGHEVEQTMTALSARGWNYPRVGKLTNPGGRQAELTYYVTNPD